MKKPCDAHLHLIPPALAAHSRFYKGVWTDRTRLYEFLDEQGIERALLTYPTTDADSILGGAELCGAYNAFLADVVKEKPKVLAAGLVDLQDVSGLVSAVRSLRDRGVTAVSVPSSCGGRFDLHEKHALLEAAEAYDMPIVVHSQTTNPVGFERIQDPLLMPVLEFPFDLSLCLGVLMTSGVLSQYRIRWVFSSLGGVVPFLRDRLDRVYAMLRQRGIVRDLGATPSALLRGVYVDTAGASADCIRLALDLFGEDRVLWGSDYPVAGDVGRALESLDQLGDRVRGKILSENFHRLFASVCGSSGSA